MSVDRSTVRASRCATSLPTAFVVLSVVSAGCALERPVNPSFSISRGEAKKALRAMSRRPVELERPVIVLGGYLDPGLGPWWAARGLRKVTGDSRFITVEFFFCSSFDECRAKLIDVVERELPSDDPEWTSEVDVVALSMGGLVARHAAAPRADGDSDGDGSQEKRLRMRRLFTISTPHRGARLARLPCFMRLHTDMRAGSRFLAELDAHYADADREYDVFPYIRLRDRTVGPENASPHGEEPIWVPNPFLQLAHVGASLDARITADIARRLRGEPPFAEEERAPLPEDDRDEEKE